MFYHVDSYHYLKEPFSFWVSSKVFIAVITRISQIWTLKIINKIIIFFLRLFFILYFRIGDPCWRPLPRHSRSDRSGELWCVGKAVATAPRTAHNGGRGGGRASPQPHHRGRAPPRHHAPQCSPPHHTVIVMVRVTNLWKVGKPPSAAPHPLGHRNPHCWKFGLKPLWLLW